MKYLPVALATSRILWHLSFIASAVTLFDNLIFARAIGFFPIIGASIKAIQSRVALTLKGKTI